MSIEINSYFYIFRPTCISYSFCYKNPLSFRHYWLSLVAFPALTHFTDVNGYLLCARPCFRHRGLNHTLVFCLLSVCHDGRARCSSKTTAQTARLESRPSHVSTMWFWGNLLSSPSMSFLSEHQWENTNFGAGMNEKMYVMGLTYSLSQFTVGFVIIIKIFSA